MIESADIQALRQLANTKQAELINKNGIWVVQGARHPGLEYFSSTRLGGFSQDHFAEFNLSLQPGESDLAVARNKAQLVSILPGELILPRQVHGKEVFDADDWQLGDDSPIADALVTSRSDRVIGVLTADCLPVVFANHDSSVIGVAHAGWRGLLAGVLENTVGFMGQKSPQKINFAWIGPSIGQAAFEVGQEVVAAFIQNNATYEQFFVPHPDAERKLAGKYLGDLCAIARHKAEVLGVTHIQISGFCTYTLNQWFFSYRRSANTGRIATLAYRKSS